jgi:hypothetical protein
VARVCGGIATTAIALALTAGSASAVSIPSVPPPPSLPAFSGHAFKGKPIRHPSRPPQNPYLAKNPGSNIHDDTWMTDAYRRAGPLGSGLRATSEQKPPAVCGSIAFDTHGQLVSVCPSAVAPPQARIIDPDTLATIASYNLPNAPDPPGTKTYQNFAGGGYFFLDNRNRLWVPTKTDHIYVLREAAGGTKLVKAGDYDLTGVLDEATQRITSALPDFNGLIWFASKQGGTVGTLDPETGRVKVMKLGEEVENSFAVGERGVFIVSGKRMYRFQAKQNGKPYITWHHTYPNSGIVKPSQVDAGSGTTPTILNGGYVAITDNANRMDVVVYRTRNNLKPGQHRKMCQVPVFKKGASATENTLVGAGRSLLVENNYGYQDPLGLSSGAVTQPGFDRVHIKKHGRACDKVWTNHDVRAPTVVPKVSAAAGLVYAYARPPDPSGSEGYYWTAINFHNGKTVWQQYAGSGLVYNNNYAGITIGPDGTAYLGVIGGIVALRDGRTPTRR